MQRLDFRLPDFCRISWVSEAAQARVQPLIASAQQLIGDLELQTVRFGMRACALFAVPEGQFASLSGQLNALDLSIEILDRVAISGRYASTLKPATSGPFSMWCAAGGRAAVEAAVASFSARDTVTLGRLLGYPECCVAFFNDIWDQRGFIDTTWPMAQRTKHATQVSPAELHVEARPENNILLRWVGVRPVFHLPCSFDCAATFDMARAIRQTALDLKRGDDVAALYEMLAMPAEWSALHGIAEIVTPTFKIAARTDATGHKYTVRLHGTALKNEAPDGLAFPFKIPSKRPLRSRSRIDLSSDHHGSDHQLEHERWYFEDNGFFSKYDMDYAHRPLIEALSKFSDASVLDLGCGNGALLRKALARQPSLIPFGVDLDVAKLDHARLLLPAYGNNFIAGNFFEPELFNSIPNVDVIFFMLGRLTEMPNDDAAEFLRRLRGKSRIVLAYAYADWLGSRTLKEIGDSFGVRLSNEHYPNSSVAQIIWSGD